MVIDRLGVEKEAVLLEVVGRTRVALEQIVKAVREVNVQVEIDVSDDYGLAEALSGQKIALANSEKSWHSKEKGDGEISLNILFEIDEESLNAGASLGLLFEEEKSYSFIVKFDGHSNEWQFMLSSENPGVDKEKQGLKELCDDFGLDQSGKSVVDQETALRRIKQLSTFWKRLELN